MKRFFLATCMLLAGCAERSPATTSDAVFAAQYDARSAHGVLTGAEAQIIADSYRREIGRPLSPPSDSVPAQ